MNHGIHYTVGTAGHVDHGKSSLVQALTGINPDRWEEEQRREMTIDLGFAWLSLPSGRTLSLVDVPGHERFIKNMLAGVGGLDAVLFVIAADEGVQPQTVEHVHILDLLGIDQGLIVLTKHDLVDQEWLELIHADVSELVQGSSLAHMPRVAVSARTGQGLDLLQHELDQLLAQLPPRQTFTGEPRLPIDRVFTVSGFGTVVTGTLLAGSFDVGTTVELQPGNLHGRIRGLQTHETKLTTAVPGSRVAINLGGIDHHHLAKGMVVALPGTVEPTTMLDLQLRLVDAAPPLHHNTPAEVFVGTAAVSCHVALLDQDVLEGGTTGWVQLRLAEPLAAVRGDRCILRRPSPSQTIGGGVIINAHPQRHRRFRDHVIDQLETLAAGTPQDLVMQALSTAPVQQWSDLLAQVELDPATAHAAASELLQTGQLLLLTDSAQPLSPSTIVTTAQTWQTLHAELLQQLAGYHQRWPLRQGINREELRGRLKLAPRLFHALLAYAEQQHILTTAGPLVRQHDWQPTLTATQQQQINTALAAWHAAPTTPPALGTLDTLDAELRAWVFDQGLLVRVSPDIALLDTTYAAMLSWIQHQLASGQPLTLASFRDHWNTTRKYAQAMLEHTDAQRITRRAGDERIAF